MKDSRMVTNSFISPIKVAFGCDHAGYALHTHLINVATSNGYAVIDCGTFDINAVDYPDYAEKVVEVILASEADFGVLMCGTGIGMSIAANRHSGIRAALCTTEYEAIVARQHNNANILCLGGRVIGTGVANTCLFAFLKTGFSGGYHQNRLDKIDRP
jgi:ribose 5-phosphate isomerase B